MSEISKQGQAIIEAARGMDDPLPGDKERILELLQASIGQIGAPGAPASPATETEGKKGGIFSRNKILLLVIAGILLLGGATSAIMLKYSTQEKTEAVEPGLNLKTASPPSMKEKNEGEISSLSPGAQPTEIDTEEKTEEKTVIRHRKSNKSEASSTEASDNTGGEGSTLKEELRLLNNAQMARRSGHIARALSYLREHEQRFPNGLLVEEREAARVFTYCKDNRIDAATAVTNRFLARFPSSPLTGRVKSSCVFENKGGDGGLP